MKLRDVVIASNAAWEVVSINDKTRQAAVKLIAGQGTEARINEVPRELLVGQPIYRRIDELADVDVFRAAEEVSRYVDVAGCGWDPRKWVAEFKRKYPAKSAVPDETTMFGWFACVLQAGESKAHSTALQAAEDTAMAKRKKTPVRKRAKSAPIKAPIKSKRSRKAA